MKPFKTLFNNKTALLAALTAGMFLTACAEIDYSNDKETLAKAEQSGVGINYAMTQSEMDSYYSSASGMSGDELKAALHEIINDHTKFSYSAVWDALSELDEDPNNSDNVILIYTRDSRPKEDHGTGSDDWNREHMWPKSHGFPTESWPAYTDLHHLRPADVTVNSARGTKDFDDGGDLHHEATLVHTDTDSWEPPAEVKGDIARAMFYMAVRYEGDRSNEPDLELVEDPAETSSEFSNLAKLSTLLEWNEQDPVSSEEINRNNKVYELYQGNRNPFIDHPEWVDSIFGDGSSSSSSGGSSEVDLDGYTLELYQNGSLKTTIDLSGAYSVGDYIVAVRSASDASDWASKFSPSLTADQIADIEKFVSTSPQWQVNGTDDSVKLYNSSGTLIDSTDAPYNEIKRRTSSGSYTTDTTSNAATEAPSSISGYSSPVYIYELGEASSSTQLTDYYGNYVILYVAGTDGSSSSSSSTSSTSSSSSTTSSSGGSSWQSESQSVTSVNYPSNYTNDQDTTYTFTQTGASKVRVHFSAFNTESNYDFVYILDGSGNTIATYTGSLGSFTSEEVDGSTLKVRFVSDYSVTKTGWAIDTFEYYE